MGLFTSHRMTVKENRITRPEGTRQPVAGVETVATDIPCRITGTNNDNIKLFVLKKYYDKIPGGIHKNFIIAINGIIQEFTVAKEPLWAGGVNHHIEATLEES